MSKVVCVNRIFVAEGTTHTIEFPLWKVQQTRYVTRLVRDSKVRADTATDLILEIHE